MTKDEIRESIEKRREAGLDNDMIMRSMVYDYNGLNREAILEALSVLDEYDKENKMSRVDVVKMIWDLRDNGADEWTIKKRLKIKNELDKITHKTYATFASILDDRVSLKEAQAIVDEHKTYFRGKQAKDENEKRLTQEEHDEFKALIQKMHALGYSYDAIMREIPRRFPLMDQESTYEVMAILDELGSDNQISYVDIFKELDKMYDAGIHKKEIARGFQEKKYAGLITQSTYVSLLAYLHVPQPEENEELVEDETEEA